MVEICAAVARNYLFDQTHLVADLLFKFGDTYALYAGEFVPLHVQDTCGAELACGEALVEIGSRLNLFHQLGRDNLASLIVECVGGKHFGFEGPVLVNLGREFYKVAFDGSAACALVLALAQQAVQGMAEFVKHGLHLVDGEQRRCVGRGLVEVAHIHNDRADVPALIDEIGHPCASPLGVTGIVIGDDNANKGTVGVADLKSLALRIVQSDALDWFEADAVEF